MTKTWLALAIGTLVFNSNAFAGGGTLNPDPSRGGIGECHTTWASDGSTREVCTGGARPSPVAPSVGRETPTPVVFACPTAIAASADFAGEGMLEVLATADHASTYVGSVTSCHYILDRLTLNGVRAAPAEQLELEFYSAGRVFLSMITAGGEKVRLSILKGRAGYGEPATATFFVVPGFAPAELYQPLRVVEGQNVDLTIGVSTTVVPVR